MTVVKFTFICNVSGNSYERAIAVLPGMEKEELLKEIEKSVDFVYPIVADLNLQYDKAEKDALAQREEAKKVKLQAVADEPKS